MAGPDPTPLRPVLIKKVLDTIERYSMICRGDRVLVALSGGPDSVALLHVLNTLVPHYDLRLTAAHLNHGLRQAAAEDQRHVLRLTRRLGISCHTDTIVVDRSAKGSLEERARRVRYDFLDRVSRTQGCTKIAVGHQADDNAEAVLLHLLRGSGMRGLGGIPPVRGNRIIRPLIHLRRNEILAYLHQHGLPYVEDESNRDLSFDRNRIRHKLLPLLAREYNPNIVAALQRTADVCHEDESWLGRELQKTIDDAICDHTASLLTLHLGALENAPLALRRRIIREALRRWLGHLRRYSVDHIDAVLNLLPGHATGKRVSLPDRVQVKRTAEHLSFARTLQADRPSAHQPANFRFDIRTLEDLPETIRIPTAGCTLLFSIETPPRMPQLPHLGHSTVWFDLEQLVLPLTVRNARPGDRLTPFGMNGSQKLKKLFIDRKIPRIRRSSIPILLCGQTILWVAGVRRSETAPITDATERALVVRLVPLD